MKKSLKKVDVSAILWFYQTDLGKQLIATQKTSETRTTIFDALSADQVFDHYPNEDDELLIHGIVDGYFEFPEFIQFYDFKTDFILHPENPAGNR